MSRCVRIRTMSVGIDVLSVSTVRISTIAAGADLLSRRVAGGKAAQAAYGGF